MKNKFGILLICLGAILLLSACALFFYNQDEEVAAEQSVTQKVVLVEQAIQERETMPLEDSADFLLPFMPNKRMSVVEIEGYPYVGYLSIPTLKLDLPIMDKWSYAKLRIAPCRYAGDLYTDDLVLMAHNYMSHFGKLSQLRSGDLLFFTDMDGNITAFEVIAQDVLEPGAIEEMTAGDFDLTLFTCTFGGEKRVTVRCDKLKMD